MEDLTPFTIYLIMQANSVLKIFVFGMVASGLVSAIFFIGVFIAMSEEDHGALKTCKRILKLSVPVVIFCILALGIFPSTKTLVTMYAVPAAIKVADGLELDDTAKKSVKAVNKLLDAYLKEEAPND